MAGLALSVPFLFSCSHGSGGGSPDDEYSSLSSPQTVSWASWSSTTAEAETSLGNTVSDILCLYDADKTFELYKNISSEADSISFQQLFYKGTYSGSIRDGMQFIIAEELDTGSFDEEMMQIFNLTGSGTESAKSLSASRAAAEGLAAKLSACKEKLKSIRFKNAAGEKKTMSTKFDDNKFLLQDANGAVHEITEKIIGGYINLDGFVFTGNPCNTRKDKDAEEYYWPGEEEEGAITLKKSADGKYTCTFRMDNCWGGKDTLIRLAKNNWEIDWGLSAIDIKNSSLPSGAYITNDTEVVNNTPEQAKYRDPRTIALAGLESKRKYDIAFDTKKSPGKICIDLKRHEVSSLDGWLFSGTPVEGENHYWPGNEAEGALPLKKNENNNSWTVAITVKEGWNGFKLIKEEWTDVIGWSQVAHEYSSENGYSHNDFTGGYKYALDDDDVIAFSNEDLKGTVTFTIDSGLIKITSDIK